MKYLHTRGAITSAAYAVFASFCLSSQALSHPIVPIIPERESTPEQHLTQSEENLKAIKEQLKRFTHTQLTDDTVMILEPNALKIRSEFQNGLIRTELKAENNGDLVLRISMPF